MESTAAKNGLHAKARRPFACRDSRLTHLAREQAPLSCTCKQNGRRALAAERSLCAHASLLWLRERRLASRPWASILRCFACAAFALAR
jgi:hypothetical protein